MEDGPYNYIQDLDTVKDSWKLKVKILSLWKTNYQLELILLDEKSEKIHDVVKNQLIPVFGSVLEEGNVVMISKFGVGSNAVKYPMVKHKFKLNFYRGTTVKRSNTFDGPKHGFDFFPFSDICDHIDDPDLPVDVIGCVIHCGDIDFYERNDGKEGRRINCDLQHLHGLTVKCTLWDDYAQRLHDYVQSNQSQGHVVIVIQFGRIKVWKEKGIPTFQNALFCTKLWIDDDIFEIIDFREKFISKTGLASSSQGGSALSSQKINSARDAFLCRSLRKTIDEIVDSSDV